MIIKNSIKCNYCEDIIESNHVHDYVRCKCGKVAVDGGKEYLRRAYVKYAIDDYTELSVTNNEI